MAIRVLVVNDTQEILDIFRDILEDEGYEVILYSYAIEDMAEVELIAPDLIILDYVFGYEKSGWQMLQKLKMTRATENIPIIICTAATREVRDIQGYLQAHGIRLLPKPFDIDELLSTVKLARQDPRNDALLVTRREQAAPGGSRAATSEADDDECRAHAEGQGEGQGTREGEPPEK